MPNILNTLIYLYMWVIMLRLILQYMQVDYNNPLSQWTLTLTEPVTKQIGRFVGKMGSVDYPSIIWLAIVTLFGILIYSVLHQVVPGVIAVIFSLVFGIISQLCFLYFVLTLVVAISSWVKSLREHAAMAAIHKVLKPALDPVQKAIPPVANIDVAPAILGVIFLIVGFLANIFAPVI